MTELIQQLLDWLAAVPPISLYLLTSLFMVLETSMLVGLIVPGDAVVLLAATTVTTPGRFALLIGAATLGSLLGESIGYLIGRRFGGRIRFSRLGQRLGDHNWARASASLNGRGARALLGVRFVAVAHALLPVVAGAGRLLAGEPGEPLSRPYPPGQQPAAQASHRGSLYCSSIAPLAHRDRLAR